MTRRKTKGTEPVLDRVSPDDLLFDPENPRFAGSLKGKSQDEIQAAIYGDPYFASELVDSFLENGFIDYEPLVVRREGSKYVVVEGNRRLAAIREIRGHKEKYSQGRIDDLEEIPVLIFPANPNEQSQSEMRVYLGVRHLLGIRDWPSISKAKYLEKESAQPDGLLKVMKETRLTRQEIRRFLIPYRILTKARIDLPPEEDFWMLGEAVGRKGVQKFLQLEVDSKSLAIVGFDSKNFSTLMDDLYGPRLSRGKGREASNRKVTDTRDLSIYAKVLESDKAAKALHSGKSLDEALIYVDTRAESFKRFSKLLKELKVLIDKLTAENETSSATRMAADFKSFEISAKRFEKGK